MIKSPINQGDLSKTFFSPENRYVWGWRVQCTHSEREDVHVKAALAHLKYRYVWGWCVQCVIFVTGVRQLHSLKDIKRILITFHLILDLKQYPSCINRVTPAHNKNFNTFDNILF